MGYETDSNWAFDGSREAECMVVIITPALLQLPSLAHILEPSYYVNPRVFLVKGVPNKGLEAYILPPALANLHVYDLEQEWESFMEDLYSHCTLDKFLNLAPSLPDGYVHRPAIYEKVKRKLLQSGDRDPFYLRLEGEEGDGKTTLAAALCHDRDIRDHFYDGILWLSLSKNGDDLQEVRSLYSQLIGEEASIEDLGETLYNFASEISPSSDQGRLLVVDNVLQARQLSIFMGFVGRNVKVLSTGPGTLHLTSARNYHEEKATSFEIGPMEEREAFRMLGVESGHGDPFLSRKLAEWAKGTPLLLHLLHRMALAQAQNFGSVRQAQGELLERIEKSANTLGSDRKTLNRPESIQVCMAAILGLLPEEQRRRRMELAAFPTGQPIPEETIYALWGIAPDKGRSLLEEWTGYSLLEYDGHKGEVTVHHALQQYFRGALGKDREPLKRLLQKLLTDPHHLPNAYSWRFLIRFLVRVGDISKASDLLSDYRWLKAKLENTDIRSLWQDFLLLQVRTGLLELLKDSLSMTYQALAIDKGNLPLQLHQRLRLHWEILPRDFRQALEEDLRHSLCVPLKTDLNPIGNAFYTVELGSGIQKLILWEDKNIIGFYSGKIQVMERDSGKLLFSLAGHTQYLEDLVVAGSILASSSWDGTIRIWDLAKRKAVETITDQSGIHRYLEVVGDVLVSGSGGYDRNRGKMVGTLKSRDIRTGKVLHSFGELDNYITSMAVSGNVVVAGINDGPIKSWILASGEELVSFTGYTGTINHLQIVGDILLANNEHYQDYSIWGWEMRTGRHLFTLKGHTDKITCLAVYGDILLSGSEDGTLRSWDIKQGKPLQVFKGHSGKVLGIALYRDTVVSCSEDGTLRNWNILTGEQLRIFLGHSSGVAAHTVSGRLLVSGDWAGAVKCWDLESGGDKNVPTGHVDSIRRLEIIGGIVVTASKDATVRSWDLATGKPLKVFKGHMAPIKTLSVYGGLVVSGSEDGTLRSWNLATGKQLQQFEGHEGGVTAAAIADGVLYSADYDSPIRGWDLATGKELRVLPEDSRFTRLASAPGMLVSSNHDSIKVLDPETGKELKVIEAKDYSPFQMAIIGDTLVTASSSPKHDTLRSWDLSKGLLRHKYMGFGMDGHVRGSTCFNISGGLLVSAGRGFAKRFKADAGYSNSIISWDLESGKALQSFWGHTKTITGLQVAGGILISGSHDGTIRLWELDSGRLILSLFHDEGINRLNYEPESRTIVAGGKRGGMFFYKLNSDFSTLDK
ncbi:NB-ARC domain-containing protein [Rufibacter roseolus]|uniref:NB-ARC domain-containing protein n=1 Tax=Rufibacter roseolus TaxID=2817375 RepID=UPI001B31556E|nr:NB-ARC domain-containing protein [Rufibacter roseolus]